MVNTSLLNTIILISIVSMTIVIFFKIKKTSTGLPSDYNKIKKTYDNLCKDGLTMKIPAGEILSEKYPLIGNVTIPDKNVSVTIPLNCN